MKSLAAAALAVALAFSTSSFAQDKAAGTEPTAAQKKQQDRMRYCNERAGARKGNERKNFMSSCLRTGTSAKGEKMTEQQARMRDCNRQAGDKRLKGDERKQFMSSCLKS